MLCKEPGRVGTLTQARGKARRRQAAHLRRRAGGRAARGGACGGAHGVPAPAPQWHAQARTARMQSVWRCPAAVLHCQAGMRLLPILCLEPRGAAAVQRMDALAAHLLHAMVAGGCAIEPGQNPLKSVLSRRAPSSCRATPSSSCQSQGISRCAALQSPHRRNSAPQAGFDAAGRRRARGWAGRATGGRTCRWARCGRRAARCRARSWSCGGACRRAAFWFCSKAGPG